MSFIDGYSTTAEVRAMKLLVAKTSGPELATGTEFTGWPLFGSKTESELPECKAIKPVPPGKRAGTESVPFTGMDHKI